MSGARRDDTFPPDLERWTAQDWREYRARVGVGQGTTAAMDAVLLRRRRASGQMQPQRPEGAR